MTNTPDTRPFLWTAGLTHALWAALPPSASQKLTDNVDGLVAGLLKTKGPTAFVPKRNGLAAHAAAYAVVASRFGIVIKELRLTRLELGNGWRWVWIVKEGEERSDLYTFGPDADPRCDAERLTLLMSGVIGQMREFDGKAREGMVLMDIMMAEYLAFLLSKKTGRTEKDLRNEATQRVVGILKAHHPAYEALRRHLLFNDTAPPELLSELLGNIRTPGAAQERGAGSVH